MKEWYLVSYDVRDDKRLRKTAKLLSGYGSRIQYSIFRCHLSDRSLERLRWELSKVLEKEDGLLVVGLCGGCVKRLQTRNAKGVWAEDPTGWTVV